MDGLSQAITDLTNATSSMTSQSGVPEGLTQQEASLKEAIDSLDGTMKELAKSMIELNTSTISLEESNEPTDEEESQKGFLDSLKDDFKGILGDLTGIFGFGGDKKANKDNLGNNKATKVKPKAEDLLKLSEKDALGYLLIASKLDELKDSQGKDKKKSSLGDVFSGLLKGVAGIALLAVALVVFAGAAILFSFLDWGAALTGLVMFSGFVVGSILLAKLMSKNLKDFKDLAMGSMLLSAGLLAFSLALIVTAWAGQIILSMGVGGIAGLIIILGLYAGFTLGAATVGKILGENTKYLKDLAIGGILLSVGLVVFSLALVLVTYLQKLIDINACLDTLILYGVFVTGAALLGRILGENSKAVINLAIGSLLLCVGLIAFSLALYIVQYIAQSIDIVNGVLPTLGLFSAFILLMAGLGKLIENNMSSVIAVAVGSLVMTISLFLFALTLNFINEKITDSALIQGLKTLGLMALFITAFALIGLAIVNTGAIVFIGATVLAILGISLAMFAFSKVIEVIHKTPVTLNDYKNIGLMMGLAGMMIAAMIPLGFLAAPAIAATILFSVWAGFAAKAFVDLNTVVNVLNNESFINGLRKADSFLVNKDGMTISRFINDVMNALPNPVMIALFNIKMGLFEALTINMATSFLSLQKVISSIEFIRNKMPSDKDMEPVLTLMERVVNVTSRAIDSVKGTSAKALASIGQTVKDICGGIDALADVVMKLKSIDQNSVNAGTENIKLIIQKLFSEEGNGWSIPMLFNSLKKVSKAAGSAAEALVPITTSLKSLSETVKGLVGIQNLDEGIANASKMGDLMSRLAMVFSEGAGQTGGLFRASSSQKLAEAKKAFDQIAVIIAGPVKNISTGISTLDSINGLGRKIENVMPSDIEGFPNRMKKFSQGTSEFKKGIDNFNSLNNVKLDKLDVIKSALTDISKITLVDTLRPITELLNRSKDLDKVKTSLEDIAKITKKNDSVQLATVQAAPKLTGSESTKDILSLMYQQMFEGTGVKISNWPTFETEKSLMKDTITPVQNFL